MPGCFAHLAYRSVIYGNPELDKCGIAKVLSSMSRSFSLNSAYVNDQRNWGNPERIAMLVGVVGV